MNHGQIMEECMYVGGAAGSVPSTESIQARANCKED